MKYNVGDVVTVHFDENSDDVPNSYPDMYEGEIGAIVETVLGSEGDRYYLDICEDGDYFLEEELSLVGGVEPIDFDEVFELIN